MQYTQVAFAFCDAPPYTLNHTPSYTFAVCNAHLPYVMRHPAH